jgi:hypothetical protein
MRLNAETTQRSTRRLKDKMDTIVLVSCSKNKLNKSAKARDLYIGQLFRASMAYAYCLRPKEVFILSAKHCLLHPDKKIDPYDCTLNEMTALQREHWASRVFKQLKSQTRVKHDRFVFLAGKRYRENLVPHLSIGEVPMKGLGIGEQLHFLNKMLG